ncbi:MAG: hypothetical protein XD63_0103 [Thermoanaerobacterales bacterium 50_218]|nr:MAG: hypothetical protein XD63_0103 [Thermoanaerobacterales bacterium 50_218]HAA90346.1 hypothetical protein [Peptococcaceae bacterium]
MCECCTPKEHLGHLHVSGVSEADLEKLNEVVSSLPGVFRATLADHGESEAVVLFDKRVVSPERIREALAGKGYKVS